MDVEFLPRTEPLRQSKLYALLSIVFDESGPDRTRIEYRMYLEDTEDQSL